MIAGFLAARMKEHQYVGVSRIWKSLVVQHEQDDGRKKNLAGGFILAHSMGA